MKPIEFTYNAPISLLIDPGEIYVGLYAFHTEPITITTTCYNLLVTTPFLSNTIITKPNKFYYAFKSCAMNTNAYNYTQTVLITSQSCTLHLVFAMLSKSICRQLALSHNLTIPLNYQKHIAAKRIQRVWRQHICNPEYLICRKRLYYEFTTM